MANVITDFASIPGKAINEISFMLGSIEECNSDYLMPILEKHGYSIDGGFLTIEPDDDKELSLDIYNTLLADYM